MIKIKTAKKLAVETVINIQKTIKNWLEQKWLHVNTIIITETYFAISNKKPANEKQQG